MFISYLYLNMMGEQIYSHFVCVWGTSVYVCVCMHVHTCLHMCRIQRHQVSSFITPSYSLRHVLSLLNLELAYVTTLMGQKSPLFPGLRLRVCAAMPIFIRPLGFRAQVLMIPQQVLYWLRRLPSPKCSQILYSPLSAHNKYPKTMRA